MIRRKLINPLLSLCLVCGVAHTYWYQVSSGDLLCVSFISAREFHLKCSEEELTYSVKALHICWERLKVGGERDNRRWDGWMASLTQWTWVWVHSMSWWWTGRPVCCSPWGHKESDMTGWLNRTELIDIQKFSEKFLALMPMRFSITGSDISVILEWLDMSLFAELLFINASVQFSSVTLCNPMNCSTPGLPVHHQLPESTQTHVHQVDDAIQPSHPLSSPSPPALNLSQHQGLFQ